MSNSPNTPPPFDPLVKLVVPFRLAARPVGKRGPACPTVLFSSAISRPVFHGRVVTAMLNSICCRVTRSIALVRSTACQEAEGRSGRYRNRLLYDWCKSNQYDVRSTHERRHATYARSTGGMIRQVSSLTARLSVFLGIRAGRQRCLRTAFCSTGAPVKPVLSIVGFAVIAPLRHLGRVVAGFARGRTLGWIAAELGSQLHQVREDVGLAPQFVGDHGWLA